MPISQRSIWQGFLFAIVRLVSMALISKPSLTAPLQCTSWFQRLFPSHRPLGLDSSSGERSGLEERRVGGREGMSRFLVYFKIARNLRIQSEDTSGNRGWSYSRRSSSRSDTTLRVPAAHEAPAPKQGDQPKRSSVKAPLRRELSWMPQPFPGRWHLWSPGSLKCQERPCCKQPAFCCSTSRPTSLRFGHGPSVWRS